MSWHAISRGWRNRKAEDRKLLAMGIRAKKILKSNLIRAASIVATNKATIDFLACMDFIKKVQGFAEEAKEKMIYQAKSKKRRYN